MSNMKQLPDAATYEKEFKYFPWGELIGLVQEYVEAHAPRGGRLVDLACGPGYLLGLLHESRPDLEMAGVDIDKRYIEHAQKKYKDISFVLADLLDWQPSEKFDVVVATAGLHHLSYDAQPMFIKKVSDILSDQGFAIIADPYVDNFTNEPERKVAAAKLGFELTRATIERDAPDDMVQATLDIQFNDVMGHEFKTSIQKIRLEFEKSFRAVEITKVWPKNEGEYGDYFIIAKK